MVMGARLEVDRKYWVKKKEIDNAPGPLDSKKLRPLLGTADPKALVKGIEILRYRENMIFIPH